MACRSLTAIIFACLTFAPALPVLAADAARLVITGKGAATATPDMATIRVGIERRGKDTADVIADADKAIRALMDIATNSGIAARDQQTSNYSLNPIYADRRANQGNELPKVIGYAVSHTLTVRVRDLDVLGGLLSALVSGGASRLNGISFGVADEDALTDAARRDAVADAKRKAALYAEAAGVTLGKLISLEESGGFSSPVQPQFRAMAQAEVAVAAGETGTTITIRMVWEVSE